MMKFPTEWKVIKNPWFHTTNQKKMNQKGTTLGYRAANLGIASRDRLSSQ
jgi:hypothetical protein